MYAFAEKEHDFAGRKSLAKWLDHRGRVIADMNLTDGKDGRSAPRKRLAIPVIVQPEQGAPYKTQLRDLSLSGFSASTLFPEPVSSTYWLTLPGREPMQAQVIWAEHGLIGCAFAKPLGQVTYDAILERWLAESPVRA